MTVNDIYDLIDRIAPFNTQLPFDNAGLLIGDGNKKVTKIGVCLDITNDAIAYAAENGIDLIVAHHPIIFDAIKCIKADTPVFNLIKRGISAICAHTNLDAAKNGVNQALAQKLELSEIIPICDEEFKNFPPIARMGRLCRKMNSEELCGYISEKLGSQGVRVNDIGKLHEYIIVFGGAGNDFIEQAKKLGADALITSEIKQHQWLIANEIDLTVFDAGHYYTENVIVKPLCEFLTDCGADATIIPQKAPYTVY